MILSAIVFYCAATTCDYEITPPIFESAERCLMVSSMVAGINGNKLMKRRQFSDTRYVILCFDSSTNYIIDAFATDEEIEKAVAKVMFDKIHK
jgi:hypothetical protein